MIVFRQQVRHRRRPKRFQAITRRSDPSDKRRRRTKRSQGLCDTIGQVLRGDDHSVGVPTAARQCEFFRHDFVFVFFFSK